MTHPNLLAQISQRLDLIAGMDPDADADSDQVQILRDQVCELVATIRQLADVVGACCSSQGVVDQHPRAAGA